MGDTVSSETLGNIEEFSTEGEDVSVVGEWEREPEEGVDLDESSSSRLDVLIRISADLKLLWT